MLTKQLHNSAAQSHLMNALTKTVLPYSVYKISVSHERSGNNGSNDSNSAKTIQREKIVILVAYATLR